MPWNRRVCERTKSNMVDLGRANVGIGGRDRQAAQTQKANRSGSPSLDAP
jgi:hypothetical protein